MSGRAGRWAVLAALSLGLSGCAFGGDAGGPKPDRDVAAEIGGQKITVQEMDDFLKKTNSRAFQEFYDARRAALDQLIAQRLMEAEASSKSVTVDKLRQDVVAAVPAVTDSEIESFYNQNKARMGAATLDQTREQIRNFLASQRQQQAMSEFISGLRSKGSVRVYLEPPRSEVRIAADDPFQGPKDAPIQLVEFSDFQ